MHLQKTSAEECRGGSLRKGEQPCSRRILKVHTMRNLCKEGRKKFEKKIAVCAINGGGKKPNAVSLEEQVVQIVQNSTKIETAKVKNVVSSTVDNFVSFEIPTWKEEFLSRSTYEVGTEIKI